jgi:hypothetical protein
MIAGSGRAHLAAAAAVGLAAAVSAATVVRANDLWWHLAAGAWILEHRAVPRTDPFSFTSGGVPWVDHAWLWQAAASVLHGAGGAAALVLLKAACALVVASAAMWSLRRAGWGAHAASVLVLASVAGCRFRWADRPDTASLAFLAVFLAILAAPDLPRGRRALLAAAVCAVWANVHAGVLLAPILAAVLAAGDLLAAARGTRPGGAGGAVCRLAGALDAALAGAASAAGLMLNPYGIALAGVPRRLESALADPRLVNPEWLPPSAREFPFFHAALALSVAGAAAAILGLRRREAWRALVLLAAGGGLAASGVRHVGVFFVILPFAAAAGFRGGIRLRAAPAPAAPAGLVPGRPASLAAAAWGAAAAVLLLAFPAAGAPPGFGVAEGRFPVEEADYVAAHLPPPRGLYNDVAHGGYLIHRFFPEDRVFVDGRNEVHASLLKEIAGALDDGAAWGRLLERHGIRAAIVRYRDDRIRVAGAPEGETRSFAALHFPARAWALVHWGDAAMVFVKSGAGHDDLVARDEYRRVHPEDWEHLLQRVEAGDAALREGILSEIRRRLSEGPACRRARDLLERFEAAGRR